MKTYGGVDVWIHAFLTSELVVSGQLHAPAALPPGKEPLNTHWIEDWVDPMSAWMILRSENSRPYRDSNSDSSIVQPVVSCYTDYATAAYITGGERSALCLRCFNPGAH
jgi:hypothetical protein